MGHKIKKIFFADVSWIGPSWGKSIYRLPPSQISYRKKEPFKDFFAQHLIELWKEPQTDWLRESDRVISPSNTHTQIHTRNNFIKGKENKNLLNAHSKQLGNLADRSQNFCLSRWRYTDTEQSNGGMGTRARGEPLAWNLNILNSTKALTLIQYFSQAKPVRPNSIAVVLRCEVLREQHMKS